MRATYLEIYQEEVRDLLSKNPDKRLEVKESAEKGVYVKGLVHFVIKSVLEINSVLQVRHLAHVYLLLLLHQCLGHGRHDQGVVVDFGTASEMSRVLH